MSNGTNPNDVFRFPVLIGDIGGTNARFALVVDAYAEPKSFPIVQTANYANIEDAIQEVVLDQTSIQPRTAILAVAGPVNGDEIDLTNNHWVVRPRAMIDSLALEDVVVLNDFEAQALAVVALDESHMEKIGGGKAEPNGGRAVLGPGTGLGVAGLVHARHIWVPVPGEGGHIDVGPRTDREREVFPHVQPIEGRISAEQMLCGRGIINLYRAVCAADGVAPVLAAEDSAKADPAPITAAAADGSDKQAAEAIDLFSVILGRVAGDIALIFMARGGVYLAGGISQILLPALRKPAFRAAFDDKAPHSALMRDMPIYVLTHPTAALVGLAAFARMPARFGMTLDGRRWTGH